VAVTSISNSCASAFSRNSQQGSCAGWRPTMAATARSGRTGSSRFPWQVRKSAFRLPVEHQNAAPVAENPARRGQRRSSSAFSGVKPNARRDEKGDRKRPEAMAAGFPRDARRTSSFTKRRYETGFGRGFRELGEAPARRWGRARAGRRRGKQL
jgi:hypothetical protein